MTKFKVLVLISVLLIAIMQANAMVITGRSSGRKAVQDVWATATAIVSTGGDTTDGIFVGDAQSMTLMVAADTVGGGGTVDVNIYAELSWDNTTWSRAEGLATGTVIISGFAGYEYQWYHKTVSCPYAPYIRFIAIGTASNSAYTYIKGKLLKQP